MYKNLLLLFGSLLIFSSCKKYDEGGPIRKAEKNLTKEWAMERGEKNGSSVEVVKANPQIGEVTENWIFNDDGTCKTEDGSSTLTGTWSLSDNSIELTVVITSPSSKASTQTYEILKLTKGSDGEMVWKQLIGSDEYRYELRSSL